MATQTQVATAQGPVVPPEGTCRLRPLPFDACVLSDRGQLGAWQRLNREATLPHVLERLEDSGVVAGRPLRTGPGLPGAGIPVTVEADGVYRAGAPGAASGGASGGVPDPAWSVSAVPAVAAVSVVSARGARAAGNVGNVAGGGDEAARIGAAGAGTVAALTLRAVPHARWANREPGAMRVWIPVEDAP